MVCWNFIDGVHMYTYNTRIFIVSRLLNLEKRRSCVAWKIAVNQLTATLRNNFNPTVLLVASSRLHLSTFAFFSRVCFFRYLCSWLFLLVKSMVHAKDDETISDVGIKYLKTVYIRAIFVKMWHQFRVIQIGGEQLD